MGVITCEDGLVLYFCFNLDTVVEPTFILSFVQYRVRSLCFIPIFITKSTLKKSVTFIISY